MIQTLLAESFCSDASCEINSGSATDMFENTKKILMKDKKKFWFKKKKTSKKIQIRLD